MNKKLLLVVIVILVIGIPIAKKYLAKDDIPIVEVELLQQHKIEASILASGQLKHEQEVKLSAEVIGKVTELFVKEGDQVSKGQLVLQIDDDSYLAALEQQAAVVSQQQVTIERQKLILSNLRTQWKRKEKLFKRNLLDENDYESATNSYEVAKVDLRSALEYLKQVKARLDQAKDQLSKTRVIAPIDGSITSLDIKEGETAISGTTNIAGSSLMTIANPKSMLAEINVDEADIANIAVGQSAEIISIAFPDKPIKAIVESIASSAKRTPGRQNLSFAVKLRLYELTEVNLRPGMSCRAEVFTEDAKQKLALPIKAIKTDEDNENSVVRNYVFKINQGIVEKVFVQLGVSDDNYQEVISGLQQGDKIATGPDKILRHLKNEQVVVAEVNETSSDTKK
jgi:HlyD family secretion protein